MRWIRNTAGQPDAILTFACVGFLIVIVKVLIAGVKLSIFGHDVHLGDIDGGVIAALLTPTLGAYVARRYTDKKFGPDGIPGTDDDILEDVPGQREPK